MTYYLERVVIMELGFDAILCCKVGKENSDAGNIECSRGPQDSHPAVSGSITWRPAKQRNDLFTADRPNTC